MSSFISFSSGFIYSQPPSQKRVYGLHTRGWVGRGAPASSPPRAAIRVRSWMSPVPLRAVQGHSPKTISPRKPSPLDFPQCSLNWACIVPLHGRKGASPCFNSNILFPQCVYPLRGIAVVIYCHLPEGKWFLPQVL